MKLNSRIIKKISHTISKIMLLGLLAIITPSAFAAFDGDTPLELDVNLGTNHREVTSVSDGNGGIWTAWIADNLTSNNDQIIVSRIGANGDIILPPTSARFSEHTLTGLKLIADPTDVEGIYFAFTDNNDAGAIVQPRLYLARVITNLFVFSPVEISAGTGGAKTNPVLVAAAGDVVLAWTDFRSGQPDIYANRLSSTTGAPVWTNEVLVAGSNSNENSASIAVSTGDSDLFIGYTIESAIESIRVAKLKTNGGNFDGPTAGVVLNTEIAGEAALSPTLISDTGGGFYAAWHQGVNNSPVALYLSRWNSSVMPVGTGIINVANTGKTRSTVDYSAVRDGTDILLTWMDDHNNLGNDDVYVSRINLSLLNVWVDGGIEAGTSTATTSVSLPAIIGDGSNGAFVSYSHDESGSSRLRTRHISASGDISSDLLDDFAGNDATVIGNAQMVATTDAIVAVWPGNTTADANGRVFAQVFSGDVQASRISTPIASSPIDGAQVILGDEFTLEASVYAMSSGEAHDESTFRVVDSNGNAPFATITTAAETSFTISAATSAGLIDGETYTWQVRYRSITDEVSKLSTAATFVVNGSLPPTISALTDQVIDLTSGDTNATQAFTLSDPNGDVNTVTVTATSNNQTAVSDANISITGTGANRSVTVTPTATNGGDALITLTATDDDGDTATSEFTVNVTSAPRIEGVADMTIDFTQTTSITITLNVIDPDAPDLAGLAFSVSSSDTSIVATTGIVITPPTFIGDSTLVELTAIAAGTVDITIGATDVDGHATSETFTLTVDGGTPAPTPTPAPSSGGGGGSLGLLLIFALLTNVLLRRERSTKSSIN